MLVILFYVCGFATRRLYTVFRGKWHVLPSVCFFCQLLDVQRDRCALLLRKTKKELLWIGTSHDSIHALTSIRVTSLTNQPLIPAIGRCEQTEREWRLYDCCHLVVPSTLTGTFIYFPWKPSNRDNPGGESFTKLVIESHKARCII